MRNISSPLTIQALRSLFARFGLPRLLVSDNGRQLISEEMEFFLTKNNIKHVTSPPYTPSSNGAAENSVKIVKNALKKALTSSATTNSNVNLSRFLFDYRNTPHSTTGVSPAILMFGRPLRTRFSNFLPGAENITCEINHNDVRKKVENVQKQQIKQVHGQKNKNYVIGEEVLVKDYRNMSKIVFITGKIKKKIGKCTYMVEVPELNVKWKRHANQIRPLNKFTTSHIPLTLDASTNSKDDVNLEYSDREVDEREINLESDNVLELSNNNISESPQGRPKRLVKPIERLVYK